MSDPIHPLAADLARLAFALGKTINAPSSEGKVLGEHLARWADNALKQRSPNHIQRCATCAFRHGTYANQCTSTLVGALACLASDDGDSFMCHEREGYQCVGYAVLK